MSEDCSVVMYPAIDLLGVCLKVDKVEKWCYAAMIRAVPCFLMTEAYKMRPLLLGRYSVKHPHVRL